MNNAIQLIKLPEMIPDRARYWADKRCHNLRTRKSLILYCIPRLKVDLILSLCWEKAWGGNCGIIQITTVYSSSKEPLIKTVKAGGKLPKFCINLKKKMKEACWLLGNLAVKLFLIYKIVSDCVAK